MSHWKRLQALKRKKLTIGEQLDKELTEAQKQFCTEYGIDWLTASSASYGFDGKKTYVRAVDGRGLCSPEPRVHTVRGEIAEYVSPSTGKVITTRREMRADMKGSGCREFEGVQAEQKEAGRQKAYQEQREDRKLHKTVISSIMQMPENQRRQLLRY